MENVVFTMSPDLELEEGIPGLPAAARQSAIAVRATSA